MCVHINRSLSMYTVYIYVYMYICIYMDICWCYSLCCWLGKARSTPFLPFLKEHGSCSNVSIFFPCCTYMSASDWWYTGFIDILFPHPRHAEFCINRTVTCMPIYSLTPSPQASDVLYDCRWIRSYYLLTNLAPGVRTTWDIMKSETREHVCMGI